VSTPPKIACCRQYLDLEKRHKSSQEKASPEAQVRGKQISRRFGIVVGVEFTAIATANVLLSLFNHPEFIAPVKVLIAGRHFLPLAFLFRVRVYSLAGTILSLLGGGALLALFFGLTLGSLYTWSLIVGLSTAVILWLTSLSILADARRVLSLLQQSPEGAAGVPVSLSVNTTQGSSMRCVGSVATEKGTKRCQRIPSGSK
jgi:hypothetical protein